MMIKNQQVSNCHFGVLGSKMAFWAGYWVPCHILTEIGIYWINKQSERLIPSHWITTDIHHAPEVRGIDCHSKNVVCLSPGHFFINSNSGCPQRLIWKVDELDTVKPICTCIKTLENRNKCFSEGAACQNLIAIFQMICYSFPKTQD